MTSLVIPTYNEAEGIEETLRRAAMVLQGSGEEFELIVVDDASPDGTAVVAEGLGRELPVRVLRREGRGGIATAVVAGWAMARGDVLGVMDADLQHPPEMLGTLLRSLRQNDADLAVATRYVPGGGTAGWSWLRRFVSWAGVRLGASALPWSLGQIKDPGSGMFLVRAVVLKGVRLDPLGIKTLVEVLARARYRKLVEVPYVFQGRARGKSKLGARQFVEYLQHLARLARATGELSAWIRYGLTGLLSAAVNVGVLYLLVTRAGWRLGVALPVAIQLALLSAFLENNIWTFRFLRVGAHDNVTVLVRFFRYEKLCLGGAVLNGLVTFVLSRLGVGLLAAACAGVLVSALWDFVFNVPAIWRIWGKGRPYATSMTV